MSAVTMALTVYLIGTALALWRTDASWPSRILLAVVWPIGPAAFVLTVALLLAASLIAFPLLAALVAVSAVAWIVLA